MADVFSTQTTHAKFIPEIWSKDTIIARESVLVMAGLVRRFDADVASYGQTIHVPNVSNLTGGDISTATGQLDSEAPTENEVQIVVNKWKGVRMKVLDILLAQSKYPFRQLYTEKMGYNLGVFVEDDLLALVPAAAGFISQNVGTYNTDLTDANFRRAVQYLDDARVPFADRHMILKPAQKNNILGIDKFVRYDSMGSGEAIKAGQVPGELYGVMTHVSPEVYKTGNNTSNFMFHRDCLALAMQKDIKIEQFARVGWLDDFGGSELYGVKVLRADHGVELKS
jgi:hypothetical protein